MSFLSSPAAENKRTTFIFASVIVLATLAAYQNSFSGAYVFDDRTAIAENPSIHQLWPLGPALSPPFEAGTGGRPVANYTFAISYALSGEKTWGHHLLNFLIHAGAALAVFGVVRRMLLLPLLRRGYERSADRLAFLGALVWALHPIATQSVTYISQRTELLYALFYVLTFYCFLRSIDGPIRIWQPAGVAACWLGVASKEVMVTAPVVLLIFDRILVAGSFAQALRERWRFYAGLFASWIVLAVLLASVTHRGVGLGLQVSSFDYAVTECRAVVAYLGLGWWPCPLIFDYGLDFVLRATLVLPQFLLLLALLGAVILAVWRGHAAAVCGSWFFLILAPTSSVVPIIMQPMAINRLYLPLVAVVVGSLLAIHKLIGQRAGYAGLAIVFAFGTLAHDRNKIFQSEVSVWSDTVQRLPQNARAHYNLGVALDYGGRRAEAIAHYEIAVQLQPNYADAHSNLGNALTETGRATEALPHLETAVRLKPDYSDAHYNLGNALRDAGRFEEAIKHYQIASRLDPADAKALNNLGAVEFQLGRKLEAKDVFAKAAAIKPNYADAHNNLGAVLTELGHPEEGLVECEKALQIDPNHQSAHDNVAKLRSMLANKK